jgi:hypothetical protein
LITTLISLPPLGYSDDYGYANLVREDGIAGGALSFDFLHPMKGFFFEAVTKNKFPAEFLFAALNVVCLVIGYGDI